MQVSVEKISSVERRLTIIVPSNVVEEKVTEQINNFAKNASIKGFRPGKAPLSFIRKRYGADARQQALGEVIETSLKNAINQEKLRPISTPQVEPKVMAPDQPLEFTASFEILPEIGEVKINLDQVDKLQVTITDADIDHVVHQIQKQYTKWNKVDRDVQSKDRVVIDYHAIFEGKEDEENKVKDYPLEINGNTMLPGFEEGLLGAKANDEVNLNLKLPDDFHDKEKAGKPIEFVVKVKQVYEAEEPKLDEDFMKQLGIADGKVETLREQIKSTLILERDRLVTEKLKEQVFTKLLEQNAIEVPQSLINDEAKRIHNEIYPHHGKEDHHHTPEENGAFLEAGRKRVALGLLLGEYARQADIKADPDRVKKRIEEISTAYEQPDEVIKWLSSEEGRSGGR